MLNFGLQLITFGKSFFMRSLYFLFTIILMFSCNEGHPDMPAPTNGTEVLDPDSEDGDSQVKREKWFEAMHLAAPGTNWKAIEYRTALKKAELKKARLEKDGQETIVDSLLYGEWFELGSDNQSGSVHVTEYDVETDQIWTIADGGTLFKGARDGSKWEVVNQDFRFSRHLLKMVDVNGSKRLLASILGLPHYSDDLGSTWTASTGTPDPAGGSGGSRNFVFAEDKGQLQIFCVSKKDYWSNAEIYRSSDLGETYELVYNLQTYLWNSMTLCNPHHTDRIFLMYDVGQNKPFIREFNFDTNIFDPIGLSDLPYGDGFRHNLIGAQIDGELTLYSYNHLDKIHKSTDLGITWEFSGNMPASPWEVGMFISPSDPDEIFFGEVECYKALGGGFFWEKINDWGAYYSDVEGSLHADIMYFNEFETADGETFQLVSNHGGLSISYDYLTTVENIGLKGLNVSQYYDVKTDPNDPWFVYAGTQDQGFQRGKINSQNQPADFEQVISGDYGHITFSRNGEGMWFVYPGGSVSFYNNPKSGNSTANFDLESQNETVWIPPLEENPHSELNEIYMAGGHAEGLAGSFIIKLKYWAGWIQAENLPFDFHDYSGGEVSAIEVSPINPNLMYAATTNGFFFYSTDAGQNWELSMISVPEPHYLYGATIHASALDENVVWIGGSGYSSPPVFYSDDMGANFTGFNTNLPPTLVFELTANEDESMMFAATEAGPYVYLRETDSWHDLSGGTAPNTRYWSVEWLEEQQIARFGTYGRGAWDFQIQEPVSNREIVLNTQDLKIFPNPASELINIKIEALNTGEYVLEIYDMLGKRFHAQSQQITQQSNEVQLRIDHLPKGQYVLSLANDNLKYSKQFIKN